MTASTTRKDNLARAREQLMGKKPEDAADAVTNGAEPGGGDPDEQPYATYVCPHSGTPMFIIDTFLGVQLLRAPPTLSGGRPWALPSSTYLYLFPATTDQHR